MKKMIAWIGVVLVAVASVAVAGENAWTSNGPYGGAVAALAIDSVNPQTIYAGTHFAGIFVSKDEGVNWSPLNPRPGVVNAIAVDISGTIYAGTHPTGGPEGTATFFMSTDAGANWVPSIIPNAPSVWCLAIDPSGAIYAGTQNGVFKGTSTNGVISWSEAGLAGTQVRVLMIVSQAIYAGTFDGLWKSVNGGAWTKEPLPNPMNVQALAIDPSGTVYAGGGGGVVKKGPSSTDTWVPFNSGLGNLSVSALAVGIDNSNPPVVTVYAGKWGEGVYKSVNEGSWQRTSDLPNNRVQVLSVAPSGTIFAGTFYSGGVYKSTNGGLSWSDANRGLTGAQPWSLAIDTRSTPSMTYAGTCAGAFKAAKGGTSWTPINSGLLGGNITSVAVDPSVAGTIYALDGQMGGGVFKSTDEGANWGQIFTLKEPDGSFSSDKRVQALAIAPSGTIYAGTTYLGPGRNGGVFRSTNDGSPWPLVFEGDVWALAVDPSDPNTIYVGTNGNGVWRSTDGEDSWAAINEGLPANANIRSLALGPASIYAVIGGAGPFVREKGDGKTWGPINGLNPWISALVTVPNTQTVYAVGGEAYRSLDGGNSWQRITSHGLPQNEGLNTLAVDLSDPPTIYAGTGRAGIFEIRTTLVIALSSTSLMFDPTYIGVASQKAFTISNKGGETLSIAGITVNGADASQFMVSPTAAAIPPGESKTITVTFAPASEGPKSASLSVAHNAAGSPATVDLSGIGKQVGPGIIITCAGTGAMGFSGDGGPAINASLNKLTGVAKDLNGNVYIVDRGNNRVRWVGPDGIITTFAGIGPTHPAPPVFSGDGGPAAQAGLAGPLNVAAAASGDVYITTTADNRVRLVRNGRITTFAENLNAPWGIAVGGKQEGVYIAEVGGHRVLRVDLNTRAITTVAGTGAAGFSGDNGPATGARLNGPNGVAVDTEGNLYIADEGNQRIRLVGLDGKITTVAGSGNKDFSGDGGPATLASLNHPRGVAVDANGNIYIADEGNHRIRRVGPDGKIETIAGSGPIGPGTGGYSGDGGPATQANLYNPSAVTVDAQGFVYVADTGNFRVRLVSPTVDTTPPKITLKVSPTTLWPPNHKMVLVAKGISVTDNSDPAPSLDVTVTSNEPDNGLGDGDTALDWEVKKNQDGTFDVWVRAERSGKGSGRIYTITATTRDASGNEAMSSATVTVGHDQGKRSAKVSASGLEEIPETFGIDQNSPNPFNPVTTIRYALPEGVDVQIVVYNILGQQVKALVSGKQGPGYYTATWDGRDEAGRRVASGVYLYRLQAGSFVQVRKMLMVK